MSEENPRDIGIIRYIYNAALGLKNERIILVNEINTSISN